MISAKWLGFTVILVASPLASAQFQVFPAPGYPASSVTVQLPPSSVVSTFSGAPYFGTHVMEMVRKTPDGTNLRSPNVETRMFRDSAGRTRTERPTPMGFTIVEVADPVAGYQYLLDPANAVAHRAPLKSRIIPAVSVALPQPPARTRTTPDGNTATSEPLGTRTIAGVETTGVRLSTTYPPGSRLGNDRPVTSTTEMWNSPRLGLVVLTRMSPRPGEETTISLRDLDQGEPDPELFRIPQIWKVVDETNAFSIVIAPKN